MARTLLPLHRREGTMSTIPGVTGSRRRGMSAVVKFVLLGSWIIIANCTGPTGPEGPPGSQGPSGPGGDGGTPGQQGCNGLAPGQTAGLVAAIQVSAPPNGSFFAAGDKPVLTIKLNNGCGQALKASDLGTAWLVASGPRRTLQTTTATKLLNAVIDRAASDHQHHYINLIAPSYADSSQGNLTVADDRTITYRLAAVSNELPGTYTAGIWAVSKPPGIDQVLKTADFQIGTATVESYASGNPPTTKCYDCHLGSKSGKSYQAHILPGFSAFGNYALDQTPIANCQLCHNNDGYAAVAEGQPPTYYPNPIVRKVHAAHRGENQRAPGAAHHEYGLGFDRTLSEYTNIAFPPLLGHDKDCTACHTDDRWKTAPSRLACGTCHDNLFFDTGTLNPPRNFGRPTGGACHIDPDCASFGYYATCDVPSGNCIRASHGIQTDDSQCVTCHTADPPGLSSISAKHEIYERTRVRHLRITNFALSGASGPNGAFLVGDTPTMQFKLTTQSGTVVADLITNAALSGSLVVSGPADDRQRIYGPNGTVNIKTTGTLTYNPGTTLYTYVFPTTIPAQAFAPLNDPSAPPRPNVSGSYTVYLYVNEAFTNPTSFRDYASVVQDFKLMVGAVTPSTRPRQVISNAACNSCHIETVAHGASRRDPEACGVCHTAGAQDRIVGGIGRACTIDTDCPGFMDGWENCQTGMCTISVDPTPNVTIKFSSLVHKIHFARLLEGYAERNDLPMHDSTGRLVSPGQLAYVGFQNTVVNLSEILFPQDIRNCTKCHTDTGTACTTTQQCGIGQECQRSKCVNRAWVKPSGDACTTCHDSADAYAHWQLNTYQSPDGPIESCDVCHGEHADFAVEKVHNIWDPYVPPYPRTKE